MNINNYSPGRALNLGVKNATKKIYINSFGTLYFEKLNEENIIKDLKNNACVFSNQIPVWYGKKITKRYLWSHFSIKEQKICIHL